MKSAKTPSAREVTAVLGGAAGERPHVEIPFDVREAFGSARAKVVATVHGVKLRTTVAVYGGKSYVGFREDMRRAMGIKIGDTITVALEADVEEREVVVPPDLAALLKKDGVANAAFDKLAFTHRKEYVEWIVGAKKAETRERRLEKTLEMLKKGTKHP
jgi:hypothetical protein